MTHENKKVSEKVSDCCGAKLTIKLMFSVEIGRDPMYEDIGYADCCSKCSQPCTPVEAKEEKICACCRLEPCRKVYAGCKDQSWNSPAPRPAEGWEERYQKEFGGPRLSKGRLWQFIESELAKKDEEIKKEKELQVDILFAGNDAVSDVKKAPMGVSQWREHGKKFGYWEYFEKEATEEGCKKAVDTDSVIWEKSLASYRAELREKIEKILPNDYEFSRDDRVHCAAIKKVLSLLDQEDKPNPPRE